MWMLIGESYQTGSVPADQCICSMPSASRSHECCRSSHTEIVGAGKEGSANALTGTATTSGPEIRASGEPELPAATGGVPGAHTSYPRAAYEAG